MCIMWFKKVESIGIPFCIMRWLEGSCSSFLILSALFVFLPLPLIMFSLCPIGPLDKGVAQRRKLKCFGEGLFTGLLVLWLEWMLDLSNIDAPLHISFGKEWTFFFCFLWATAHRVHLECCPFSYIAKGLDCGFLLIFMCSFLFFANFVGLGGFHQKKN